MLANGLGQMAKGAEAAARRPATPPVKFSFGYLALGVSVNGLESLTQTHRTAKFGVLTTEIFTLLLTILTEVPSVAAEAPHRSLEIGSLTVSSRRTVSSAAPASTMTWNLSKTILARGKCSVAPFT